MTEKISIKVIDKLSGFKFEQFIKDFLLDIGFQKIEVTKKSGDFGVDVIAYFDNKKWAVQTKRWNKAINIKAIQEVYAGMTYYSANKCMVISNREYSKSALELSKRCDCKLVGRKDILKWLNKKFQSVADFLTFIENKSYSKYKLPTKELLREYQSLKEKLNRQPTIKDIDKFGKFSSSVYQRRWGSWTDFLKSIGETPIQLRNIPKQDLIDNFSEVKSRLNKVPTTIQMEKYGKYSISTYCRVFKSWNNFLKEVNEHPTKKHRIPKDDFIKEFERVKKLLSHVPTTEEMQKHGKIAPNSYKRLWGSWSNFLKERNEQFQRRNIPEDELIKAYLKLKKLLKKTVTQSEMDKLGEFSSSVYLRRFGNWNKFLNKIGENLNVNTSIKKEDLFGDYNNVKGELNKSHPSANDIKKHGKYAVSTYIKHFGSWNNFVKEAVKNN